jgi:hypothetical protein
MLKRFMLCAILFTLSLASFVGCLSSDHRHNRRHMWALDHDLEMLHRTTDRHFFNFDWDDPYRN